MGNVKLNQPISERQALVLAAIIQEYVKSAEPVGSKTLVDNYNFEVSPATIRNDMLWLEEQGYIVSPHTSAGRTPTELGYQYYVRYNLAAVTLDKNEQQRLKHALSKDKTEPETYKEVAQVVASLASETVFWSLSGRSNYQTGWRFLFEQPEFREPEFAMEVGNLMDQFEEAINSLMTEMEENTRILIGSESPFGRDCSAIIFQQDIGQQSLLFGLLGPTRMDYDNNLARLNFIRENL
jgi:transcriptional regulator of heat shock response